jgi:hypothetical protein
VTRDWEVRDFAPPEGLTRAQVDAFTGRTPSPWSRRQSSELFIRGTSPGEDPYLRGVEVVRGADGGQYLWENGCQGQPRTRGYLVLDDAEAGFPSWNDAVKGWLQRARRGAGVGADVSGAKRTYTAYFFEPYFQPYGQTWGGPFAPTRSCRAAPSASPSAEASAAPSPPPAVVPEPSQLTPPEPTPPPPEPTLTPPEPTLTPPEPTPPPPEPTPPPPEPTPPPPPVEAMVAPVVEATVLPASLDLPSVAAAPASQPAAEEPPSE